MKKIKLGDCLEVTRGMSLPGTNYANEGIRIRLTLGNFDEKNGFKTNTSKKNIFYTGTINKKYILKKGDIITPLTEQNIGLLGSTAKIPEDNKYIHSQDIGLIKCKEDKLYPNFCYYLFSSSQIRKQISDAAQQTKIRHTSPSKIMSSIAYIPELTDQIKISKILDLLSDKINLNNKINAELEKMANELYDYWFVQFDFPDEFGRPYKSSGGKMVYAHTEKRNIPYGWKYQSLYDNDLTKTIGTGIKVFDNEKIYIPTANVNDDKITDLSKNITYIHRESRANMQPIENSVWFAKMKNTNKKLHFGDYSKYFIENLILSTGFCGLQCKSNSVEYIWKTINTEKFEEQKDALAHGATQQSVNNEDLSFMPILIPTTEILSEYHKRLQPIYKQKYYNELENINLISLRDFLIPLLMNGQVTVNP